MSDTTAGDTPGETGPAAAARVAEDAGDPGAGLVAMRQAIDGALTEPEFLEALDRALFDANPDLVWHVDLDGTVRRTNRHLAAVLGYAPDEIYGRPVTELELPESGGAGARAFAEALAGRASVCETAMRHRDGRAVRMRAAVMPLVVGGAVVGVFVSSLDVTAEHDAARRLAEGEALYRLLVDQSPESVAIGQDERFVYTNPAGAALHGPGLRPADMAGRAWRDFVHPDDWDRIRRAFAEVLGGPAGEKREYEKRLVRTDGRVIEVEGVATCVAYHGRPAVHTFSRDVTARRRVDAERLRAQRMESLGRLAAGVAHDFNNLLAVMLVAVESAAAMIPDDDPLREDLADAADAARRGRGLTRQLLTFARREGSRPATFAVNEVVRNLTDLMRRLAGPGVRLSVRLAPDAGAVTADPAQVEQALLNLVANAREALPGGAGRVAVETAREDGEARVTVRDSGPGVPDDVRPHLFEPFFTTKPEGTGLGLATVYGVVTGAGGRVEVESAPGEGAAFHLYFPEAARPAAEAVAEPGAGPPA